MALGKEGLIARHWRGDYSLARSFWVHYLLAPIVVIFFILIAQAIVGMSSPYGDSLGSASMLVLVGAWVWGMVGTWRAANKAPGGVGKKMVTVFFAAQLLVIIGGFVLALMYLVLSAISGPPH
jgi:quinol-cytochrome oxidoreductase complex cytochrome b subunit